MITNFEEYTEELTDDEKNNEQYRISEYKLIIKNKTYKYQNNQYICNKY